VLIVGTIGVYAVGHPRDTGRPYSAIFNPGRDPTWQQRQWNWDSVTREVPKKPLGHGLGTAGSVAAGTGYQNVNPAAVDLDNSYLEVAYQQGLLVMALLGAALVLLLIELIRGGITSTDPESAGLGIASAGVLFAIAIEGYGTPAFGFFPALVAWLMIGLGLSQFMRGPKLGGNGALAPGSAASTTLPRAAK